MEDVYLASTHNFLNDIGTPAFLPALLAEIHHSNQVQLVEPAILQSILLCLVAGDKHLILRTSEADISLVVRLSELILSTIYGLQTHRLRIHAKSDLDASQEGAVDHFLRALFLQQALSADGNSIYSLRVHNRSRMSQKRSISRSTNHTKSRSYSYPDDLIDAPHPTIVSPVPVSSAKTLSPLLAHIGHALTDPTPIRTSSVGIQLPNALIISGLENASMASQMALTQSLLERQVVLESDIDGVWPFPEEFIVIYVCSMDTRERPSIHRNLLDRFAMSATITLQPNIRTLATSFFHSYRSPPATAGHTPSSTPTLSVRPLSQHYPVSHSPIISPSLLEHLRATFRKTDMAPHLSLYLADLFTAARHYPELEGRLLTAVSVKDASDLARAWRVVGGDPTGAELIKATVDGIAESETSDADTSWTGVDVDISGDYPSLHLDVEYKEEDTVPVLSVSAADIARIVPRVMSHRVRVRDGPHSEVLASAIYSATQRVIGTPVYSRKTIKDILVKILAEV